MRISDWSSDVCSSDLAEQVHVAEARRDASIAHDDGDLMQCFGQTGPEFPVVLGAAHAGARIALDGVIQVGEFERVAKKEDGGIVAQQIPIENGRASCRERVCQYVEISVCAGKLKT